MVDTDRLKVLVRSNIDEDSITDNDIEIAVENYKIEDGTIIVEFDRGCLIYDPKTYENIGGAGY